MDLIPTAAWHLITRLGEVQILLPVALLTALSLAIHTDERPHAVRWLMGLAAALLLTLVSKIAFIAWGLGSATFNFTGISGHAAAAASIFPMLLLTLARRHVPRLQVPAFGCGAAVAVVIAVSRIAVGAHSPSEIIAGLAVGAGASLAAWPLVRQPAKAGTGRELRAGLGLTAVCCIWLASMPVQAPVSQTHAGIIQLSLRLSGHSLPYTRDQLRHRA